MLYLPKNRIALLREPPMAVQQNVLGTPKTVGHGWPATKRRHLSSHQYNLGAVLEIVSRALGEYFESMLCHQNGMLPLGRRTAILGNHRPLVRQ